jgi:hypothetical protein
VRGTHFLPSGEGKTSQDTKRKRESEGHSPTGQVRSPIESERARGTHFLSSTEGVITQDTKRKRESEGHSRTAESRVRGKSGHQAKSREREALANCRA